MNVFKWLRALRQERQRRDAEFEAAITEANAAVDRVAADLRELREEIEARMWGAP